MVDTKKESLKSYMDNSLKSDSAHTSHDVSTDSLTITKKSMEPHLIEYKKLYLYGYIFTLSLAGFNIGIIMICIRI